MLLSQVSREGEAVVSVSAAVAYRHDLTIGLNGQGRDKCEAVAESRGYEAACAQRGVQLSVGGVAGQGEARRFLAEDRIVNRGLPGDHNIAIRLYGHRESRRIGIPRERCDHSAASSEGGIDGAVAVITDQNESLRGRASERRRRALR